MKRALLIVAVFVMANVALAGDCTNGTCQPVRKVVKAGLWLPTVQTVQTVEKKTEVTVEKKTTTTKTNRVRLLKRFRLFR